MCSDLLHGLLHGLLRPQLASQCRVLPLLVAGWLSAAAHAARRHTCQPLPIHSVVVCSWTGTCATPAAAKALNVGPPAAGSAVQDHADPSEWRWCRLPVANRSIGSAAQP